MTRLNRILGLIAISSLGLVAQVFAQTGGVDAGSARRGVGLRVGTWNVQDSAVAGRIVTGSPQVEVFFQKGLDEHLALESTASLWVRKAREIQGQTGNEVQTRSFVIPLMTALKLYPVTTTSNTVEPFFAVGIGFALGLATVSDNAIGGGGASIQTGFAMKGAGGFEIRLSDALGISVSARYQWIRFADELGTEDVFKGAGLEGGIVYRSQF
jgi:hypothetical protein